ncbi:hypothetical protein [Ramlibacter sp. WS9]|uniref:hypothetical protein n=1 Tax=Ramlibacter sp. WS9 TaxID=1882741 RepID=UPI0011449CFE|nr:hypothetical protein [Ramlibacter sp. WS9]ROZ61646.1 hypothetical protein EEB15_32300 [Ramlibacter sp. WS9]
MSQSIYIIDLPTNGLPEPSTLQEMWEQIEPRLDLLAEPNPKFVELAKRIEQKFATPDEDAEWLNNPVAEAGKLTKAAWNFGLPEEQPAEVLHEVVNQATQLGLAVLVDYLGVGFLPGRKIVPANVSEQWEAFFGPAPESTKLTKAQVVKKLKQMLGEKLAPHGFKLVKEAQVFRDGSKSTGSGYFRRDLTDGRQLVMFIVRWLHHGGLVCWFRGGGVNFTIHQILKDAALNGYFLRTGEDQFSFEYGFNFVDTEPGLSWTRSEIYKDSSPLSVHDEFRLEDDEGFRSHHVDRLLDAVAQALVSQLDQMKDVESIDRVLNKEISRSPGSYVRKNGFNGHVALVCARLTNDPGFDDVVKACIRPYSDRTDESAESRKAEIHQLANYLREHVGPLKAN